MECGNTRKDLFQSRFTQAGKAFGLCRATDFRAGPAFNDHLTDVVAQIQQLVNRGAAPITRVIAAVSSGIHIEHSIAMLFRLQARFD